jgi:N utilization substance protein B
VSSAQTDAHAGRRAARLAAVQALYQMEMGASSADVLADFDAGRLPRRSEALHTDDEPDRDLFRGLIEAVIARQNTIDRAIARRLSAGWRLERIDSVARAILRAGAAELEQHRDTPVAVVIDEYVEIAHSFFEGPEPGFINATLDACARDLRPAEEPA